MGPVGWLERRLGDLFEVKHGYAFKSEFFSEEGDFVLLTPGNFRQDGGLKLKGENEKFYSGSAPQEFILRKGDLLIAMTDLTQQAPILGRPAVVPADDRFLHNQRLGKVVNWRRDEIDPAFLYYLLNTDTVRGQIKGSASGATVRHTSPSRIAEVSVTIPPLAVQRRIADILSAYDELIENNLRRIQILEEMARALYREWFVEFRFPGHENVRRASSVLGPIPKGWEIRKLSELVKTQYGYTESASEEPVGPRYLRGMDINKVSYIDWSQVPYCPISADEQPVYQLRKGDILVIRMADPGKVGIVEEDVDAVFASYLIRVTPTDERLLPYFLFHILDSSAYQSYMTGASTGTTRKSASAGVITDFAFALPPRGLVEAYEDRAASLRALLTTILKETGTLRRTRDLLLPRLLSGQLALTRTGA